ncbi:hypothetical protein L211DRAFT_498501 [Terfezia boudieri ATCC MYA-4762]|uniref:Uncharacterized protein n=1 Tax=Terfezia boudieri ATCC MYA-4762 TaxID=1051890 RepID=A0A3N4LCS9_9PEZI|nr:hypothetical protein L211DRAFT_498501 [Terfezia boudieri ATCC MYA-4762]
MPRKAESTHNSDHYPTPPGFISSSSTKAAANKPNKSKTSKPTSTKTVRDGTARIHITPLTPTLFPSLLPRSLFDNTANYPPPVSYHTLEALPDKSYGYVDLSPQLAQKLISRLNGTVFRGVKVSVQIARPRTWIPPPETSAERNNTHQSTTAEHEIDQGEGRIPEKKKLKKEDGVYPGIEIPDGRWVKRAWTKVPITGTMGKHKDKKDKNGAREEARKKGSLLFQTTLPPTIPTPVVTDPKTLKKLEKKRKRAIAVAEAAAIADFSSSDNGGLESEEGRKIKRKKVKKARKMKLPQDKTVIKEFTSNTKFPGFLKVSQLDPSNKQGKVKQFLEGVGWVDGEGQLVDNSPMKKAVEKRRYVLGSGSEGVEVELRKAMDGRGQETKEDVKGRSSNGDDEEMEDAHEHIMETVLENSTHSIARESHEQVGKFNVSAASSSSEAENESESEVVEDKNRHEEVRPTKIQVTPRAPPLKLSIPTDSISEANKPHPLEAIFKPTANFSTTMGAVTSGGGLFNFSFANDDDDEDVPAKTFEASDNRPYRSAAPTPDTAVFSKTTKWPDLAKISAFEPTSPIAPRKLSFQHASTTVPGALDAPLLFQGNVESAYLRGLSIWSGGHLPEAKSITELPPDEEEKEAGPEALKKKKRKGNVNEVPIGKHKERKVGQGSAVADRAETRKEIWKERFFRYRGEWNKEWKNKKREAGKLARRKKRERGIGAGESMVK